MKKFLVLLLISLLAVGLLSACAGAPAPTAEEAEAPVEEAAEETTEEGDAEEAPAEEVEAIEPIEVSSENCDAGYEGETIYLHQHAGREGPLAAILGEGFAFATADAVAEINANGGVCGAMLEVVFRETQYSAEEEVKAYEEARAFEPKPFLVMTYGSGATIVLKDRVVEDEIVNVVAGLNAEAIYNPVNGYTIASAPIYSDQFAGFITWLSNNWADVKPEGAGDDIIVGVIGWANAYGAGATTPEALAIAEGLGITVLPTEEQPLSPDADVTGQLQNLMLGGANVIYNQNLSFSTAQVIGTIHALGAWDSMVVGGVNWSANIDVINLLGENAALADGYYGVFPYLGWNDTDSEGVQMALAAFEKGGYPESEMSNTYLLTYGTIYSVADVIEHAINMVGLENLDGPAYMAAMENLGTIDALGLFQYDILDGNRSGRVAQIRQAQMNDDGKIEFVMVEDFFELPDAKPAIE